MNSSKQKDTQKKIFDEIFGNYRHTSYLTGWKRAYVKRIFEDMPSPKNGKFLDIGTGSGFMVIEAVKRGMYGVGLDISPKSVTLCYKLAKKELSKASFEKVTFVVGDAEKLPFKDNSFDRICSIALLEHLVRDKEAVKEIGRVTKKEGIVSICVPNTYERTPFLLTILNKRNDKDVGHLRHYKAEDLIREFKKNGFSLIDLTYHGHTIMIVNWVLNMIWTTPPSIIDFLWWKVAGIDLHLKKKSNSMNFTITLKKTRSL